MLSIDYILNILLIVYVRMVDLSKNRENFFLAQLNLETLINKYLFISEVNYVLNVFLVFGLLYFLIILVTTNPMKPRRKGQAWKLKILIIVLYSLHTCFSTVIVLAHSVNIFCRKGLPNFSCLEGENVDSAVVAGMGVIVFLLNSYFIENIYNF